ncbi:MAG: hypothetical protein WCA10_10210 [Terracidiphilus sp.]
MGFRTDRARREYIEFIEQDRKEQAEIAERLERPIKEAQLLQEISRNAGKLIEAQRKLSLGYEETPYIPDDLFSRVFNTDEEIEAFNRSEARAFYEECTPLGWNGTQENIETLLSYFTNRGIPIIDRRMYKAAFLSLKASGLFEEPVSAPEPVAAPAVAPEPLEDLENLPRLPAWHKEPIAHRRETQQTFKGIDPDTGKPREYTQVEVDRMSAETFKKVFNVPTPALTRVNFLKL